MSYDCYRNAAKCCDSTYYCFIITKVSVTMKFKKIFSYFFYVICGIRSFTASCYFNLFPYIILILGNDFFSHTIERHAIEVFLAIQLSL